MPETASAAQLRLHNTLGGRLEPVEATNGRVGMYLCGLTPKAPPHIGHARLFVVVDVLRRYLRWQGAEMTLIQNFTDVDDKIIERAAAAGVDPFEFAQTNTRAYFEAMDALEVERATQYPKVTDFIPEIIEVVTGLIEGGYGYQVDGDVYFEVRTFPAYGQLSKRTEEDVLAGARVEVEERKRSPRDFALWKTAKPGEPSWESPWGRGRPGWHIECSTMILRTLGEQIDMHGGATDLIFPHHENEIAQSETYTGKRPFVRHWFHVGLLRINGEKMSHSLGNYVTVQDLLARVPANGLRLYLLSTHYRAPLNFSVESVLAQARGLHVLEAAGREMAGDARESADLELDHAIADAESRFVAAMDADLNTAAALGALFDLAHEINRARGRGAGLAAGQQTLRRLASLVGLDLGGGPERAGERTSDISAFIELLLDVRRQLREAKQYQLADGIRSGLAERGVIVEDRPGGTSAWRFEAK